MNDSFPELIKACEEIGFLLEQFDFDKHNDEGNRRVVAAAQSALVDLEGCIGDLVP